MKRKPSNIIRVDKEQFINELVLSPLSENPRSNIKASEFQCLTDGGTPDKKDLIVASDGSIKTSRSVINNILEKSLEKQISSDAPAVGVDTEKFLNDYLKNRSSKTPSPSFHIQRGNIKLDSLSETKNDEEIAGSVVIDKNNILKKVSISSSNKNAYEIRLDVLKEAIKWLSLETNISFDTQYKSGDIVVNLANKFYSFVENKK